ncbi:hypothetical protein QR680_012023 [Steinernema hermaphroditum]|uniref:AAA+ ATPase domain-containing protein n=1 Tax=Steinernema hermaphroditum TaxID=289476 RepID=A0AA39LZ45_9BILA|nr:hypothetical protein QR680_012023 [Steinernema hermaphroditum]
MNAPGLQLLQLTTTSNRSTSKNSASDPENASACPRSTSSSSRTIEIEWSDEYGAYTVDCDRAYTLPSLKFSVDGGHLVIAAQQYVYSEKKLPNGECVLSFEDSKANGSGPEWYFGIHDPQLTSNLLSNMEKESPKTRESETVADSQESCHEVDASLKMETLPNNESAGSLRKTVDYLWRKIVSLPKCIAMQLSGDERAPESGRSLRSALGTHSQREINVGGYHATLALLRDVIGMRSLYSGRFTAVDPPRSILLYGPSGCGKSLIVNAVNNDCQAFGMRIDCFALVNNFEEQVKTIAKEALVRCLIHGRILFLDNFDVFIPGDDTSRPIFADILWLMQRVKKLTKATIVVATRSHPASMGPLPMFGSFDYELEVGLPDVMTREEILHIHCLDMDLDDDVDLGEVTCLAGAHPARVAPSPKGGTVRCWTRTRANRAPLWTGNANSIVIPDEEIRADRMLDRIVAYGHTAPIPKDRRQWLHGAHPEGPAPAMAVFIGILLYQIKFQQSVCIAIKTHGMTGAQLASLCKEAHFEKTRENHRFSLDTKDAPSSAVSMDTFRLVLGRKESSPLHDAALWMLQCANNLRASLPLQPEEAPSRCVEEVGGYHALKMHLALTVAANWLPHLAENAGIKSQRCVLLRGLEGVGKAMIVSAVAKRMGAPCITLEGRELVVMSAAEAESKIRAALARCAEEEPAILFINDLDAIAPTTLRSGSHAFSIVPKVFDQFRELSLRVLLIAATSQFPLSIGAAILTRFDSEIRMSWPTYLDRLEILGMHTMGMTLAPEVDLKKIAKKSTLLVGAELAALCAEVGQESVPISMERFRSVLRKYKKDEKTNGAQGGTAHAGEELHD